MTAASPQIDEQPIAMTSTTALAEFAELYERHYEAVYRPALRVTGNSADAEDVLQTVFLRVLARGEDVEATSRPKGRNLQVSPSSTLSGAYFRRAAVNAAVDLLRRRAVRAESVYDDQAPHAASQSPVLLKERLARSLGVTLVTNNVAEFERVEDLRIENWTQPRRRGRS